MTTLLMNMTMIVMITAGIITDHQLLISNRQEITGAVLPKTVSAATCTLSPTKFSTIHFPLTKPWSFPLTTPIHKIVISPA